MKIAQVVCTSPPYAGGIGNSAYTFGELLAPQHQVTTFSPQYQKNNNNPSSSSGHSIVKIPARIKYGNAAFIPGLIKDLKKYDVIYLHYPFFGGAEVVWLYKTFIHPQKKLVIHYHMDVFKLNWLAKILSLPSRIIFHSLFRKAEVITCASLDYVKTGPLRKIYSKHKQKFREIPFGVDIQRFSPYHFSTSSGSNVPKLLLVGGLDPAHYFKGVEVLLQALKTLKEEKWELDIVGEGGLKPFFKEKAKQLGLEDRVNFLGKRSKAELVKIYQTSDIFLLPSLDRSEAFGIVLLEAMASGLPVIASELPGVRSVFQKRTQGLKVQPGDAGDLAEKIKQLLDSPETRKKMGQAGRELAEKKYSLEKLKSNLLSAIEK